MANTIRIKKRAASGSAGAPSTLAPSELAFNENASDLKLYYGFGDNGSGEASSIITVGGSGAFFSKTDTRTANTILAGPTSGSAAAPTFRSLVATDIPLITADKVSNFTGTVTAFRLDQLASATNPVSGVTPTSDAHFATKGYVDSTSEGLDVKQSCKVATTANITLSGTQTIDGVAVSADERVLVKDQSTASENGIYLCKASSWVRSDDLATGANAAGAFTFVEQGSTNADIGFVCTTDTATVGTNNLAFSTFSSSGNVTAGNGLDKSGNELSVDLKANGGLVIESTEIAVDLAASSITGTLAVGDGGTGATSASAARTALGLAIGTNVQAYDADLDNLSGMQSGASAALALLTSTEVGILDGATLNTTELNYVDGVTSAIQTQLDAKQASDADLTALSSCQTGAAAALALLTATEVGILDGATLTTSELNILDGVTATATEINTACDGDTSATSTTLATADRMVINDAGTMKQVALSDLVTFLEDGSTSGFDIDGGTY